MADTLHLCPCCNKLVPASHFRRAPWTPQDLSELLSHPRLRKVVMAIVQEVIGADRVVDVPVRRKYQRIIPAGYISYSEAVERYGLAMGTIRQYISSGRLQGGRGQVLEVSMEEFARNYRPRPHTRKPKQQAA